MNERIQPQTAESNSGKRRTDILSPDTLSSPLPRPTERTDHIRIRRFFTREDVPFTAIADRADRRGLVFHRDLTDTPRTKCLILCCLVPGEEEQTIKSDHDIRKKQQSPEGEEGVRRERAHTVGQRAHVAVGARAQPAPAGPLPRGGAEAEATPAHAEEPGLRRQLPRQASVAARGPRTAEEGAPARGGEAGRGERRHAEGAGGPRGPPGRPAEVRPGPRVRRRQPPGHGPPSQHRLGHHHCQDSLAATERPGIQLLGEQRGYLDWGGTHDLQCKHTYTCHMHAQESRTRNIICRAQQ